MGKVSYKRSFQCDKSIAKGIEWLNRNGYYTYNCCSGLKKEHPNNERDMLFIEFQKLSMDILNQLRFNALDSGFQIKKRKNDTHLYIETNDSGKLNQFNSFIDLMRKNKNALNLRTMGISNWSYDESNKKLYSIQFYDFDITDELEGKPHLIKLFIKRIQRIFPYDCVLYKTKHGIHFISFAILHGQHITKARAIETSKTIGNQDYWTEAKDLTLRVSDKWKVKKFSKNRIKVSKKPKFLALLQKPNNYIISEKHLEFYHKFMGLPLWVYNKYNSCDKRDYKIKIYHYKTRD